jgi:membrane protein DedA with SNARE-associated domain
VRDFLRDIARVLLGAVNAHQYVTLFFAIAIEEAGIPLPIPGDLLIAYFGWRAGRDPFEVAQVILTCALASTAGTQAPYWLARRFGHRVAERVAFWLDIDPRALDSVLERVERGGFRGVLVARLIPGLRVAVSLVAGTGGVPQLAFAAGVFVAAALYWTGWVLLGVFVGPHVADVVSPAYLRVIVVAIPVLLVVAFGARLVIAARRRARAASRHG